MKDNDKMKNSKLVPKNKGVCEWVDMGILTYKLCDRDFDCSNCPLDYTLRGNSMLEEKNLSSMNDRNKLQRDIDLFRDSNYYVHGSHAWIKVEKENEVKIGIDDLIANILGSIDSVVLPPMGDEIKKDKCFAQIIQGENIFSLISPVSGDVMMVNQDLECVPNKLTIDPLNKGWMVAVKAQNLDSDLSYCLSGEPLSLWYANEINWLQNEVANVLKHEHIDVGMTMHDGSKFNQNLKNIMTKEQYENIINKLLSKQRNL